MSGLAKMMLANEANISGSDMINSEVSENLRKLGADIKIGHSPDNVPDDIDAVVISAAVDENNPELQKLRQSGLKVYKYAEMLGELMSRYDGIAIGGTHGKSTTSGWLTFVLERAGLEPNFIVGADITQFGTSSATGRGPLFVAEACEYDRSFLNLAPKFSVILNIEPDHLDYYKDTADIIDAFTDFAGRVKRDGILIANGQDENIEQLLQRLPETTRVQTFGIDGDFDFTARNLALENGCYSFDVFQKGYPLGRARIALPGLHNVRNALAVIASASLAGVSSKQILTALGEFTGVQRRLMFKTKINDITVLDDYAHHPTEIRASLEAIRQKYAPNHLWCVFQPHQYSRTRFLLDDFAQSFKLADITVVPEIYFVRDSEQNRQQVNAQKLVEKILAAGSDAHFIDGFGAICDYLKQNVTGGDLVVTMGAGDIWKVADEYIRWLGTNS